MNIKKNLINLITHPILTFKLLNKLMINFLFEDWAKKNSYNFFKKKNLLKYFNEGQKNEIITDFIDLKNLYFLVRKRKPRCVVEFGSGFSTIAICLALKENKEKNNILGKLFSVDGNQEWIKNTENKIDNTLKDFVKFHYSKPKISSYNGQVSCLHENLPDVSPNFIYLDGPSPLDVEGEINGVTFSKKKESNSNDIRRIVAADVLLYESTAPADFFILIDRRYTNANFIEKNLVYKYKIKKKLYFGGFVSFEKKYQPYP